MRNILSIVTLFSLIVAPVIAVTINIPEDYPTIQAGIDAASDSDTVFVSAGTYIENINYNGKNIVLQGENRETTIIDGNQSGSVVTFDNIIGPTAVLSDFTITGGNAYDGGGIYCSSSAPTIKNNFITGNVSETYGGGISCNYSSAVIMDNKITFNSAYYGGGISFDRYTSSVIKGNNINGNYAVQGGGISCSVFSSPSIINNTISGNIAFTNGGGIYCYYVSSPTVTNTIIWGNTANTDLNISVYSADPIFNYCDIQGNWEGIGNIDSDPLFVAPDSGDFHLQENSPCINAGDPDSPLDPDGTIADMGAYYFDQSLCDIDAVELWGECYNIDETTEISLPYSDLTGEIPPEIGNLTNLISLNLKENQLTGEIPDEIGSLAYLTELDLGGNLLAGEIPSEISYLTNLTILDLGGNQLNGEIPPEITNLTNLTELELGGNLLTGEIPSEIDNLVNLTFIHFEYNQLTGSIPDEIGNLSNLNWLNFVHNQLTGEIPSSVCELDMNWSNPDNFNINFNQLCPPYPECIEDYVGEQDTTNCSSSPYEPPDTLWTRTLGGSDIDFGRSVQQTTDGGYIITGYTNSFGNGDNDVSLIKTDTNGIEEWSKTFGGSSNDYGRSVQQTTDGGFIITGRTNSYGNGNYDVWLIKTDSQGDEAWNQTYGGSDYDYGYSGQQTIDGGYIIAGETLTFGNGGSDVWIIKTDSNGNEQWNQTYGGNHNDMAESVQQTTDGGYIIIGNTYSFGNGIRDAWLIKIDSDGNEEWNQTFGGSYSDYSYSGQQTTDGGYIFVGETLTFDNVGYDVWVIKTDSNGNEEWNQTFGGNSDDFGYSIKPTTDGGYIITGETLTFGNGGSDVWLIKTDSNGNEEWNQTFGGSDNDSGYSVQQTSDGGYIITGWTYSFGNGGSDIYLIRLEGDWEVPPPWSITVGYQSDWNLVGLPLEVEDNDYLTIFPDATEYTLFFFDDAYTPDSIMIQGEGYWLRFDTMGTTPIIGYPINELVLSLSEGWNLISGITASISVNNIFDPNGLIIPGTIYGYTDGYMEAETIEPGYGYWLRSSGEGEIVLNSNSTILVEKKHPNELHSIQNTITFGNQTLYFGNNYEVGNPLSYSLPPKPPAGAKDIRFSGDTKLCSTDECVIEVMNDGSTLNFECEIKDGEVWELVDESGNVTQCSGVQALDVDGESEFLVLRKSTSPKTPSKFTLHQNFPNPFNPITTLRYDLPEDNFVMLTVYDMLGRTIVQLVNTAQEAGFKSVQWDATDSMGKPVGAGVYLYQIQAGDPSLNSGQGFMQTKKMVLLK